METEWVIVISVFSCLALIIGVLTCIAQGNKNLHAEHMYQVNVKSRKRVKYRQAEEDAKKAAQINKMLQGKTPQQQDIIMRQYRIDNHAKRNQDEIDRHQKQKQEGAQYEQMMRNATPEQQSAIKKKDMDEFHEKLEKERIADRELDELIERQEKIAKEGVKQSDNNMFIPNSGQYGAPVQYSLVPSQSPVTVQVWSC